MFICHDFEEAWGVRSRVSCVFRFSLMRVRSVGLKSYLSLLEPTFVVVSEHEA